MAKITNEVKILDIDTINKENELLNERFDVHVHSKASGDMYSLKIDKYFKRTLIMELVAELFTQVQNAKTKGININGVFVEYSMMLIIKYFTSIGDAIPQELSEQVQTLHKLINLEILEAIMEELPMDEINKVFTQISEAIQGFDTEMDNLNKKLDEIYSQSERDQILSEVQTSELV